MAVSNSTTVDVGQQFDVSYAPVLFLSVGFHVLVFVVAPIITHFLWIPETYERPKTFQLVTASPKALKEVQTSRPKKSVAKKPRKVPAKTPARPREKVEAREEDLSDLADLLGGLSAPMTEMAVGIQAPPSYLGLIERRIGGNFRSPVNNPGIAAIVTFTLYVNGRIADPVVTKSSGNSSVDMAALRAVRLAAPFPKMPPSVASNQMEIRITLRPSRQPGNGG